MGYDKRWRLGIQTLIQARRLRLKRLEVRLGIGVSAFAFAFAFAFGFAFAFAFGLNSPAIIVTRLISSL